MRTGRLSNWVTMTAVVAVLALPAIAQDPIEQAADQYLDAERAHDHLLDRPAGERTRADYLEVLNAYERTYLITPHTGYADDALLNVALLYEAIGDVDFAERTWRFLISEYPASRFVERAHRELDRLNSLEAGTPPAAAANETRRPDTASEPATVAALDGRIGEVTGIRYWESARSVRVVIDMDREATFRIGDAFDPPRVFLDLPASLMGDDVPTEVTVDTPSLAGIRIGQFDPTTVRVVLDQTARERVDAFRLSNPDRLIIDVRAPDANRETTTVPPIQISEAAAPPVAPVTPAPEPAVRIAPEPEPAPPARPERVSTPARPTLDGDHSLIRSLGLKIGRVVIDPGHGGHDTGTIGPSGVYEKDVVLQIARDLKERIESEMRAEVVLTRSDDSFLALEERTALANQVEADLFLSIHVNSSSSGSVRGFETYVLNMATTNADREIAARENAASEASISQLQDLVSKIMFQDKAEESREFAARVQQAMARGGDLGRDRGVKQAPFVVLIGANMPSILAEVSFISNPDDEARLSRDAGRGEIVDALFEGVRSYAETLSGFRTAQVQP